MNYLVRKGIALRKKHLKLFNDNIKEIVKKTPNGYYVGINPNVKVPKYDCKLFKTKSKNIYQLFKQNPKMIIHASIMNNFSNDEIKNAFISGYLKHDSRGYYFDTSIRALKEVKNL